MKFKANVSDDTKKRVLEVFQETEDKNEAMYEALALMQEETHRQLLDEILADAKAGARENFRQLTDAEKRFYEMLKGGSKSFRNSITADQIDILPTETIDWTLNEVMGPSGIRKLISLAPAGVKKWLVASKTGAAVWGNLTDEILGELTATISSLDAEMYKLTAYCLIPKSIRDLEIGYVDRYFTAILAEAMNDGFVAGYLYGDGKTGPIGLTRKIGVTEQDGKHQAKEKLATITKLSPKGLAAVRVALAKNGKRKVSKLYLLCNPADRATYVDPAMFGESMIAGWTDKTFMPIEVIEDVNVKAGDGIFTLENVYTMAYGAMKVNEYKETKALDDVDVVIAKLYANGRAVDDDCAVYFDITKLEEWIPAVVTKTGE